MFSHKFDQPDSAKVLYQWFLLSFNGGFINAGGFAAAGTFVSHVTGFATLFGVDMAKGETKAALQILSVPVFFLVGAFIAGCLIDRPLHMGKRPRFDIVMGLCALCLFLAASGDPLKFGGFANVFVLSKGYALLGLLCMASGLQNAALTSSSGSSVRTTHLTGLTTDLGLGISRLLNFKLSKEKYQREIRINRWRVGSIISFVIGSAVGALIFIKAGYIGFILPGLIASYAAWYGKRESLLLPENPKPNSNK